MIEYRFATNDINPDIVEVSYFKGLVRPHPLSVEVMDFNIRGIKGQRTDTSSLYNLVNMVLNSLPESLQFDLMVILREFFTYKNEGRDYLKPEEQLVIESYVQRITKLLPIPILIETLQRNSLYLNLPSDLKDRFEADPSLNKTEDMTYVRGDYMGLLAIVVLMRILSPVLGTFCSEVHRKSRIGVPIGDSDLGINGSRHAYYRAYLFLVNTSVWESPQMEKLLRYFRALDNGRHARSADFNNQFVINMGLSTHDFFEYMAAEILISKLMCADLSKPESNLISVVYQTWGSRSAKRDSGFANKVKIRADNENSTGEEGEDISVYENLRSVSKVTVGDVANIQIALRERNLILDDLGLSDYFDIEFYERELKEAQNLHRTGIPTVTPLLLGWFLSRHIDPRSIPFIGPVEMVELLCMARVVLWNQGQHFISLLLLSTPLVPATRMYRISTSVTSTIKKQKMDELRKRYVVYREAKDENLFKRDIVTPIESMAASIMSESWTCFANPEHIREYNQDRYMLGNRKLVIPTELGNALVDYLSHTQKEKKE